MGRDDNDPLFLQFKEAQDSVLAPFAGKSKYDNQGQRVVEGQRLMQASSDIFLGWIRITGLDDRQRDFYVRQLWDWKVSVDPTTITPTNLVVYGGCVRVDPGPGPRPLRRSHRHRLVSRHQRDLRPGHHRVRLGLRRPERARLRGLHRRRQGRHSRRHHRPLGRLARPEVGPPGSSIVASASAASSAVLVGGVELSLDLGGPGPDQAPTTGRPGLGRVHGDEARHHDHQEDLARSAPRRRPWSGESRWPARGPRIPPWSW